MPCPKCGTVGTTGAFCSACGAAVPAPTSVQFGSPMPFSLNGNTPRPTTVIHPEAEWVPVYGPPAPPWETGYSAPRYPVDVPYGYLAVPKPVGNTYSIIGIVLGVVALVVAPLILGLVGASLAQHAHKRGESLWKASLIVSLTGLVLGLVIYGLLVAFRVRLF